MNSFEVNKIAGGVLAAALVIFGGKTFAEIAMHKPASQSPGFPIAALVSTGGGGGVPAAAKFEFAPIAAALKTAAAPNIEAGKEARHNDPCHSA